MNGEPLSWPAAPSPTAPPAPIRAWAAPFDLAVGRIAGAGLLAWMGWIHLHLWQQGYKYLPSIGNLFLANFVGAVAVAVAVVFAARCYLALATLAGALAAAATLGSLIISINVGLFGFQDSSNAAFVHLSIWVEGAALAVLAAATWRGARFLRVRRPPPRR